MLMPMCRKLIRETNKFNLINKICFIYLGRYRLFLPTTIGVKVLNLGAI